MATIDEGTRVSWVEKGGEGKEKGNFRSSGTVKLLRGKVTKTQREGQEE